ncbi:MerR family transcriptional regulator [Bacillus sp. M6-12]|uniref:MerR family transcriptional regulator n=1 Tax=Bacillus sp. M6-12 TaxID=2054166 RepID=UPI001C6104F2|nr:MerR family transcriptional regulator [Bacillus sp. M6-12]
MGYTAQEIVELLQNEGDSEATLRMVRYYTQIGLVPVLEVIGNRRMYTEKHLDYFRAIRTMSRTGRKLADIQQDLQQMNPDRIIKIGRQLQNYSSEMLLEKSEMEYYELHPELTLQISSSFDCQKKEKILNTIQNILDS